MRYCPPSGPAGVGENDEVEAKDAATGIPEILKPEGW